MAPNNIENQIKEKLNSRQIKPTEMAWDRLDAMLTVAEEKKTKRFSPETSGFTFKYIAIAASVLVFLSAGLYFFNQEKSVILPEKNVVVNEIQKDTLIKKSNQESNNKKINNSNIVQQNQQQFVQTTINSKNSINKESSKKSFNTINQNSNSISNQNKEIIYQTNEIIVQKDISKDIPQEKTLVSKRISVNVDELLASVEKTQKTEVKPKIKVDANSLLSQVDGELEQTFRQKVINKISKNYQEVKVALANRNQEQ